MNKLKRIAALIGALALLMLVFMTLFFAFTGSPYFLASLVTMIFIPVFIYGAMIVYRALGGKNKDEKK